MYEVTPALPMDLEREFFEATYWLCEADRALSPIVNLLLVCHRVRQWLAPLLYRIAVQSPTPNHYPTKTQFLTPNNVERLGPFVKHLYIGGAVYTIDTVRKLLSGCPNLIDFAFLSTHHTIECIDLLDKVSLQRLFTNLTSLNEEQFKGPSFASITHLDITMLGGSWERWSWLRHVPQLTYVAVNESIEEFDAAMQSVLNNCKKLQVLLIPRWPVPTRNWFANFRDHRFVRMNIQRYTIEDWEKTAKGAPDNMWACATQISHARKAVEFKDEYYQTWFNLWGRWKEQLFHLAKDDAALTWLHNYLS